MSSAICVAVAIRKATAPMTKTATGKKLLLLNTAVASVAAGCAGFCNTAFMRKAEVDQGIEVYSDQKLEHGIGISKSAAYSAVLETSLSRSALGVSCNLIPAGFILALGAVGVAPRGFAAKNFVEVCCISLALGIGLPFSVSIFPPLCTKQGVQLEKEFHKYDVIYFNKGL